MIEVRQPTKAEFLEVVGNDNPLWDNRIPKFERCRNVFCLFDEDVPKVVWGCTPLSALSKSAWVWVYTVENKKYTYHILRIGKQYIEDMKDCYKELLASCVKGKEKSYRYASWLGFEVDEEREKIYNTSKHNILRQYGRRS